MLKKLKLLIKRLPCFWIFNHEWSRWRLHRSWHPRISWELHMVKECQKCKCSRHKEWDGSYDAVIIPADISPAQ